MRRHVGLGDAFVVRFASGNRVHVASGALPLALA